MLRSPHHLFQNPYQNTFPNPNPIPQPHYPSVTIPIPKHTLQDPHSPFPSSLPPLDQRKESFPIPLVKRDEAGRRTRAGRPPFCCGGLDHRVRRHDLVSDGDINQWRAGSEGFGRRVGFGKEQFEEWEGGLIGVCGGHAERGTGRLWRGKRYGLMYVILGDIAYIY